MIFSLWPHVLCVAVTKFPVFQYSILIYPMILFGLSFGLDPGRTSCAYYSLWIWIPTVDVWSLCSLILPIDDYILVPQSSRLKRNPRRSAINLLWALKPWIVLVVELGEGNKKRAACIRLPYVMLYPPEFRLITIHTLDPN